jgi:hypothetical protein
MICGPAFLFPPFTLNALNQVEPGATPQVREMIHG